MSTPLSWLLSSSFNPANPFSPGTVCFDLSLIGIVQMIRDKVYASKSSRDWASDKIVRLLNQGLMQYLTPLLKAANEEFYVTSIDIPLVPGQQDYAVPSACIGGNVRIIQLIGQNGSPYYTLNQLDLDVGIQPYGLLASNIQLGTPTSLFIQGNRIRLVPTPAGGGAAPTLRIYYYARPSYLVYPANDISQPFNAASGVVQSTTLVTLDQAVTDVNSPLLNTQVFDIIDTNPPFEVLGSSSATFVNGSTSLTLTNPIPNLGIGSSGLNVNSHIWLCHSGCAPVVTSTPPEFVYGSLLAWVLCEISNSIGDQNLFQRSQQLLAFEETKTIEFLKRRVRGPGRRAFATTSGPGTRGYYASY